MTATSVFNRPNQQIQIDHAIQFVRDTAIPTDVVKSTRETLNNQDGLGEYFFELSFNPDKCEAIRQLCETIIDAGLKTPEAILKAAEKRATTSIPEVAHLSQTDIREVSAQLKSVLIETNHPTRDALLTAQVYLGSKISGYLNADANYKISDEVARESHKHFRLGIGPDTTDHPKPADLPESEQQRYLAIAASHNDTHLKLLDLVTKIIDTQYPFLKEDAGMAAPEQRVHSDPKPTLPMQQFKPPRLHIE